MCGINGILAFGNGGADLSPAIARMNHAIAHRGPDDEGSLVEGPLALGHRRLSIIDLSSAGHQPMTSADDRFVIVFNGEIYNFRDLRGRLDYPFRSGTDTEVLLAAWQAWGPGCVDRLAGMFAFAVWDRCERELHLVRDRLGIKPLYYHRDDRHLVFSSEIRGVLASRLLGARLDEVGLIDYLRYQTVHGPRTIVDGIRLLEAGTHLRVSGASTESRRYWSPASHRRSAPPSIAVAREQVYSALLRAVERRLVADVPFGAFLSGGIDSSAVVALMCQLTDRVSTFSVSFAEQEYSEARFARRVADKFGTDHHDIRLSADSFLDLLPQALDRMDHPSGDGPNTYVVAQATKKAGITMALSGLGGDELFAGYPVFTLGSRLETNRWIGHFPLPARRLAGGLLRRVRPSVASAKAAEILGKRHCSALSAYPLYRQVLLDEQISSLVPAGGLPPNTVEQGLEALRSQSGFADLPLLSQLSVAEMGTYMQHVLLRDTDQTSMAHALEVRVPFLDHELVEVVLGIPDRMKHPRTPKRLLVESLGDLLPPEIVNRPKMGFSLPFPRWMTGELRDFCARRLEALADLAQFDGDAIRRLWNDFLAGRATVSWSRLWTLVVLQHWLAVNGVE